MTVSYTTIDGQIVAENRDGVKRGYVHDPQGNVIALVDEDGAITDTWEYWPHGEVKSHTGPSTTPFTFGGAHGYYKDPTGLTYVRARYYNAKNGQWQTMDPLWPMEQAYGYVRQNPVNNVDPSGMQHYPGPAHGIPIPSINGCGWDRYREVRMHVSDVCHNRVTQLPPGPLKTCLERRCQDAIITCLPSSDPRCNGPAGLTPCAPGDFTRVFYICPDAWDKSRYGCLGKTILHEMCHTCGNLGTPRGGSSERYCEGIAVSTYGPGKPPCPRLETFTLP